MCVGGRGGGEGKEEKNNKFTKENSHFLETESFRRILGKVQ